jgi:MFS family permease
MANESDSDRGSFPPAAYGWYVVATLTLAYVVSFIDRQILSLLIEPIRRDLGLTDFQMAWIGPPAFATCFLLFGLMFGFLADRARRTRLLAFGVFIWCLATAACAFAGSALEMFLARMAVGLGEAVLAPCALSLISDLFPRRAVGRAIGVYSSGMALGSSVAFIVGAAPIGWLESSGANPFAALGVTEPWRETFLIVGLPGLLLAVLFFVLREPPRRERIATAGGAAMPAASPAHAQSGLRDAWRYLVENRATFLPLFVGKAVLNFLAYAHFWIVPLFERTWGWSRTRTGATWGGVLLVAGIGGMNLGGWLSDRWYRAGRKDAALRVLWLALIVIVVAHTAAPLMPSAPLAILMFVPALLAAGAGTAAGSTATMLVTPNEFRGQMTSLSLLIASGLGQFLGPTSVAFLTDFVFGDPRALRYSLALSVLAISLLALALVWRALATYPRTIAELEARLAAGSPR